MNDSSITRPAGRRVYIDGTLPGVRVPAREVVLTEPNPPLRLYDTSGPYGDPSTAPTSAAACPRCAPSGFARGATSRSWARRPRSTAAGASRSRAGLGALPRSAPIPARQSRSPCHPAALRAARRHHPGDGVHRAARGRCRRIRARRGGPRPRHHPRQHQPPRGGADDHRAAFPGEDQRQHRQLRRLLLDRRGGGEDGLGHPVGRRHRHGPVHRRRHPRHPRVDPPQRPGSARAPCRSTRRWRRWAATPRISPGSSTATP